MTAITPMPQAAVAPPVISKIDVDKIVQATALIAPLLPKSWTKSSILLLSIANALQLALSGFTGIIPPHVSITLGVVLAIVIGILRVVRPNPPIAGSPQDLTT